MTLYDKRKETLLAELKDKEYRDAFVSEHIANGVPFQIKAIREQREWTQEDLGKLAGMAQGRISVLEDPNYAKQTLSTLKKLASAFDVALIVRFIPISELVEWELNLSPDSLKAIGYEKDPYFKEKSDDILEKARVSLPVPSQPKPHIYVAYDSTRERIKNESTQAEVRGYNPSDVVREVAQ